MTQDLPAAISTLDKAKEEVVAAERQLTGLLAEMRATVRAEKTSVSQIVEAALGRLGAALLSVEAAKKALAEPESPLPPVPGEAAKEDA